MKQKIVYFLIFVILCGAGYLSFMKFGISTDIKDTYEIGILSGGKPFEANINGFIEKMTELGYVEGVNVAYDVVTTSGAEKEARETIERFISDNVDIIVTLPTEPSVIAKELTADTQIPVVFAFASVEDVELIDSVLVPGNNITGVRYPNPEITLKRFEFLQTLIPDLQSIFIIFDHDYPATFSAFRVLKEASAKNGITLIDKHVKNVEQVDKVFRELEDSGEVDNIDAIFIMPEVIMHTPPGWERVSSFSAKHNIPIAGSFEFTVENGAMFSFVPDSKESGGLAAIHVDKILNGIKPGTIPVTSPESHLQINITQIESHGLEVPNSIVNQAEKVLR